ncbi:MAG: carbamate kinase [Actinomycetota bacterium]
MSGAPPLLVVALGGNAIQAPGGDDSVAGDFARTKETARHLVALATAGPWRLVITHGNGPQVGNHLLRSEMGHVHGGLPLLPLDVCVADTQGGMGYMLQQCLSDSFHEAGLPAVVVSLVTQTVVDRDDPGFASPTKPVGEMIPPEKVEEARGRGWTLAEDRHRHGWRRVVASPDPKEIVEAGAIEALVDEGVIVIAAGGGGIPVFQDADGILTGCAAVVDKDLASAMLAADLGADAFLILTDVESVMYDFDGPNERPLAGLTLSQARGLMAEGQFPQGSMGPKIEAICRYVEATGNRGAITSIERSEDALLGDAGTRISQ